MFVSSTVVQIYMIFIFFAVIYLYWFVSFFLFFVVFAIWIKETFTCKNSSRQAIIRLRKGYGGSVWREIGYVLLDCLLMTPAAEISSSEP